MRTLALLAALALSGCTSIEAVYLNTVAVNCDVTRGSDTSAQGSGQADANVLSQAGAAGGAGALERMLQSKILCRDVVAEGAVASPPPQE